jgi:hypothetical protein
VMVMRARGYKNVWWELWWELWWDLCSGNATTWSCDAHHLVVGFPPQSTRGRPGFPIVRAARVPNSTGARQVFGAPQNGPGRAASLENLIGSGGRSKSLDAC